MLTRFRLHIFFRPHPLGILKIRIAPAARAGSTVLALVVANPAISILFTLGILAAVGMVPISAITASRIAPLQR